MADDENDDTDVPSCPIIQDALGVVVFGADQASDCVVGTRKDAEHGGLVAADDGEDVWASIMERGGVMSHVLMKKMIRIFLIFAQF